MNRLIINVMIVGIAIAAAACSRPPTGVVTREMEATVARQQEKLDQAQKQPIVAVDKGIYLGPSIKIALPETVVLPPIFRKEVTLVGSNLYLNDIAERLTQLSGVSVSVAPQPQEDESSSSSDDDNDATPLERARKTPMRANYSGTFEGLLDTVASHFAMHWAFLNETGTVQFYNVKTETFTLVGTSGSWKLTAKVSNASSTDDSSSSSSDDSSSTVETGDTSTSGEQSLTSTASVDLWSMTVATIESMLSKDGAVVANMGAGSITVTDHPGVLARVGQYIRQINARLSRQVAIAIKVYTVEMEDATSHSFSMSAAIDNFFHMGVSSTPGAPILSNTNVGNVTATLLSGNRYLVGSEAVFKALSQHGTVARVASGSGVTMQNQPLPIQDVTRSTYLASSSMTINETTTSSSLTPGQVTTGFAATVVPNILDNNNVVLQYTLNLSSLDDIDSVSTGSGESEQTIQLPKVSTRAFQQRVTMPLNSTLILAGFGEDVVSQDDGIGFLSWGKGTSKIHRIIVVTIDVSGLPGAEGGQS